MASREPTDFFVNVYHYKLKRSFPNKTLTHNRHRWPIRKRRRETFSLFFCRLTSGRCIHIGRVSSGIEPLQPDGNGLRFLPYAISLVLSKSESTLSKWLCKPSLLTDFRGHRAPGNPIVSGFAVTQYATFRTHSEVPNRFRKCFVITAAGIEPLPLGGCIPPVCF